MAAVTLALAFMIVNTTTVRAADGDDDGCTDVEEAGPDQSLGGLRDSAVHWDFFDVPAPAGPATGADGKLVLTPSSARNRVISLQDVAVVLSFVGRTSANPAYTADHNNDDAPDGEQLDRTPSTVPGQLWHSGPPNSSISLQDVAVALAQVGHRCTGELILQPTQPLSGPGGSTYLHDDMIITSGGSGYDAWYVFQPSNPRPASAPVVMFLHGYYEFSGYNYAYKFIEHTVRKGYVVIYPRWQTSATEPCPGPFNIEPCMTSALNGINGGLAWLQADPVNRVQPELDKATYFGFSFGGIITANLANRWVSLGLPEPRAIFLEEPHDGGLTGNDEPALDDSLAGIPSTALVNCIVGDQGVITEAGMSGSSCNAVFPKLGHIPDANKDIVLAYSDVHGTPLVRAVHGLCGSAAGSPTYASGATDALDWFGCWKIFDALRNCALSGTDCRYGLENTPEHRSLGLWSDGEPVNELKIQDAAPIAP